MKNVDHRPVLNLKKSIQYIPYVPFKMDGSLLRKELLRKEDLHMQNWPQHCIHSSTSEYQDSTFSKIQVEGQFITIHLPMFWIKASTQGILKVNENSNFSVEQIESEFV